LLPKLVQKDDKTRLLEERLLLLEKKTNEMDHLTRESTQEILSKIDQ